MKQHVDQVPRPVAWVADLQPAVHGAYHPPKGASHAVLDFSANGNVIGPPPGVATAMAAVDLSRYPDPTATELREAIARREGLPPAWVAVGNGSTELIWAIARAYLEPGDEATVVGPTYGEYAVASRASGARVSQIDLGSTDVAPSPVLGPPARRPASPARGEANARPLLALRSDRAEVATPSPARSPLALRSDRAEVATPSPLAGEGWGEGETVRPKIVWLCHPNNPTGLPFPLQRLTIWVRDTPGALFVVDEAYLSLADDVPSAVSLLGTGQIAVLRSMTKDMALAGLRIGALLAAPEIVDAVRRTIPPWSVSSLAQAAGIAACADPEHLDCARAAVRSSRDHLVDGLARLGLAPAPSVANFVLAPVGDGRAVAGALLARGCAVRDCASFGLSSCIRIGVRSIADQNVLLAALADVLRDGCPVPVATA